ncbi:MAG: hypothetical protein EPN22_07690 [Nitrospirae bacterium]|nr:MAG: hypothetical protein EPN22_07690 [Nitrospirota bacterium]
MKGVRIFDGNKPGGRSGLEFDLVDILFVLGMRALRSLWKISNLEYVTDRGRTMDEVFGSDQDKDYYMDGKEFIAASRYVFQVIDGEFEATDTSQDRPWAVIRAVDSSWWEVYTDDPAVFENIRLRFRNVEEIADKDNDLISANPFGETALMAAAADGHIEIVKQLLKYGSAVNAKSKNGWSALSAAAMMGHSEVVDFLIAHGADMSSKDRFGQTALIEAVGSGHFDTARLLIEQGADVNDRTNCGTTPLHLALFTLQPDMDFVKLLIEKGADVHVRDSLGRTPLSLAIENNNHLPGSHAQTGRSMGTRQMKTMENTMIIFILAAPVELDAWLTASLKSGMVRKPR